MFSLRRVAGALVVSLAIVVPPGGQVATAATCSQPLTGVSAISPGPDHNDLYGVDAPRQNRAFAVGYIDETLTGPKGPLAERWNGTSWSLQTTPHPWTGDSILYGVYAPSPNDAWAVGYRDATPGAPDRPLAMRWNGTAWKVKKTPSPTKGDVGFNGVSGVGSAPLFAVGFADRSGVARTLIERWNGTSWKTMKSPNASAGLNFVSAVDAVTAKNVWAVGDYRKAGRDRTLVLHHTGAGWKVVKSPNRGTADNDLYGLVALGRKNVWAVGSYEKGSAAFGPLIEHWNGTAWKVVKGPTLADSSFFYGVDAVSAHNIWAAGGDNDAGTGFVERWNGTKWKVVTLPPVVATSALDAIAARPTGQVWAVGTQNSYTQALVFGRCT